MTESSFSLSPPPELVQQWIEATRSNDCIGAYLKDYEYLVATEAARWGADQELEACCEWLKAKEWIHPEFSDELRAARRPEPLSLKEQALEALYQIESEFPAGSFGDTIRHALEALPDD